MRNFDMLVKLYDLPPYQELNKDLESEGIEIHRPLVSDKEKLLDYVKTNFSDAWKNECEAAFFHTPISCFVATKNHKEIVGFSCYDVSYRNFFGPIGVDEHFRGKKIGKELLLTALYAMREEGYAYAIVGWSAEKNESFYNKVAGAVEIPDSFPGVYKI
ncbi:GNAT family N-acetyltransferase [Anaerosporobacter sp.]|uniref:GNAT family N-acetyltransferase n=1 Tax=Anaerosporobacter sp. TaxID=1872529 RepID=UPI00286F3532|nr:GNAT family N-acetyltransferase [Anaerosporobacter sp.]